LRNIIEIAVWGKDQRKKFTLEIGGNQKLQPVPTKNSSQ
jgi:hypothetical protein